MRRLIGAFLFIAQHAVLLAALLAAVAGAGTLALGSRGTLALRSALGMALWAHALFALALAGQLRIVPIVVLAIVAVAGGAKRGRIVPRGVSFVIVAAGAAMFVMALRPPIAFDETLYHLPFVRELALSGQLRFLQDFRMPVFPQLHELLCVPMFLAGGDVATHLVALAEVIITIALLIDWEPRTGLLAAALFAGSPIVIHFGTVTYVDVALTLFVAAGFWCLDRSEHALAGLFLGTACGVKYLGAYFAVAALVVIAIRARARAAAVFAACCAAAALPTTFWIVAKTGNPVFPFLASLPWNIAMPRAPAWNPLLMWDVTFARSRVNWQPPFTPFFIIVIGALFVAAVRDVRARTVALIAAVYVMIFAFLPQDSRYLLPLLPLIFAAAAPRLMTLRARWLVCIAIVPGLAYAIYALAARGLPPTTPAGREAFVTRRIPEYAALSRAGTGTVYVCGAEQLRYYAHGRLLGDFNGPFSYDRVLRGAHTTSAIASSLRKIPAQEFLLAKRCADPIHDGGMELVYEDAAAQLWRVLPEPAR